MAYIFEYIKSTYGEYSIGDNAFYDLGSGIGRGLIAAAFLFPFKKVVGIEYLEKLHYIGLEIKNKYDNKFEEIFKQYEDLFPNYSNFPKLELINGDFLLSNWKDASCIFANSTCFSTELMNSLTKKADEELQPGTFFITFTKRLPHLSNDKWEVREGFRRLMSWGIATVYVHRKKKNL